MAAGLARLHEWGKPGNDEAWEEKSAWLADSLAESGAAGTMATGQNRVGSMMTLFFTAGPVTDFESAKTSDTGRYAEYFKHMLENGVYLAPSQFEAAFVSLAHDEDNLARTAALAAAFLRG